MNIGEARNSAKMWVQQYASQEAGFQGAYFSGSTVALPDEDEMSPSSDLDLVVVLAQDGLPIKLGKIVYRGTLIEVTYTNWNELSSAERILSSYHLAGSFRLDTILEDPTGRLRELQTEVARHYAERVWVERRCLEARRKIESGLRALDPSAHLHDRVTSWLFPTGVTTHILLVAALRNPTVRLRYLAARGVLTDYGLAASYPEILGWLGCAHLTPSRIERHLDALARTFDAAAGAAKTPFFFSSDITSISRPIAINGSRQLLRAGNHHEAMFWMVATFARCHKILAADAPDLQREHAPAFEAIVADLGLATPGDQRKRAEAVLGYLPKLWQLAEVIMEGNPDIR